MIRDILVYNEIDTKAVKPQYDRTLAMLRKGDFRAADVKKMRGTPFYRAKLNDADRLLFRFGSYEGSTYLLILEVIYGHAYEKSRFLNGAKIDEAKLEPVPSPENVVEDAEELRYVHPENRNIHFLGKVLSFDDEQTGVLALRPPVIIIGSAGSGKTVLTLEKMKQLQGDLLYVTHSPYLTECSRTLYYAEGYDNPKQEIEFLSFAELLAASGIPKGKPMDFHLFQDWFKRHRANTRIKDGHMLHEEFNGVLTGCPVENPCLSREEYLDLGVRRSIFTGGQRDEVYDLFEKYLTYLKESGYYNINMTAWERLEACQPRYDFVVVDEVQDITNVQLMFILKHLRKFGNFLLSGDSNQIVHPNFFSWAGLKTMFYEQESGKSGKRKEIMRILINNYRNSKAITDLANKILLAKSSRFGSVDRESNYLVRCVADTPGEIELLKASPKNCREFNHKTSRSTQHAVLVLREEDKKEAAQYFDTPLIFSVREAKGLEYENIILFDIVSSAGKEFNEIARGVESADLERDELKYARTKDKSDKSLEVFKFFINSLYVAVTRSINNAYFLDRRPNHSLYQLLQLAETREQVKLRESVSSAEEWQSEAGRLEQQGKTEQAEAIRERILQQKPVPWRVVTQEELPKLEEEALDPNRFNKKAKQLLFDYAMVYQRYDYMPRLAELNFKPATAPEEHRANVERRYTQTYNQPRLGDLKQKIKNHGVDFRDPLNRTPLMIAASLGMYELAEKLQAEGASTKAVDSHGRTPFMVGLINITSKKNPPGSLLPNLFRCVPPPPLTLRIGDTMIKIDPHHGLFLVFYAFIARGAELFRHDTSRTWRPFTIGLGSAEIAEFLQDFPTRQVPEYRKRRAYVSSLLSRHEYARTEYRRLFVRIERGKYLLNPELQILLGNYWVWINDFCRVRQQVSTLNSAMERLDAEIMANCLETIQNGTFEAGGKHSQMGIKASNIYDDEMRKNIEKRKQLIMQENDRFSAYFHERNFF